MPDIPLYNAASLNDAIALADLVLETAATAGASDLHLEPQPKSMRIRMRVDGLMRLLQAPFDYLPASAADALVVRFKLLSNMDIGERRRPQDGSFQWQLQSRKVDVRISSLAGHWGEKLVLRLQWQQQNTQLDQQGLAPAQLTQVTSQLTKPQGLILVTGPTGSGKSMLLYSCLKQLQAPHLNLVSAEDPVEIALPEVHQVAVNSDIGLNYNHILRALLRQDPDVIMLGELRDADSADVALKAAQTGHLLLTSMHTSSIGEAMHRCHGLGVDMLALSYCLSLIVNQRLVRRLCDLCKQPMGVAALEQLSSDVWHAAQTDYDGCYGEFNPCIAVGCQHCNDGYRGRFGIFDILVMDQHTRALVVERRIDQLDSVAGVRKQGLWRVMSADTTMEEINRVTW
ncbi:MAG TPA: Type 4 pili biogenesis protein pilB (nuleotide-binding protein) [Oceanospirillaceae bacterium]|nr:Type 4 pili biogenesis protein pilB (nuleotide-binding protein) [Oceanospirillaceae bacterium]